jgi:hypothetical protein
MRGSAIKNKGRILKSCKTLYIETDNRNVSAKNPISGGGYLMENELSSDQLKSLIKRLLWEAKNKFDIPQDIVLENETSDLAHWRAIYSLGGLELTADIDYSIEDFTFYQINLTSSDDKCDDPAIYVSNELSHNNLTIQNVYLHDESRRNEATAKQASAWFTELLKDKTLTKASPSGDASEEKENENNRRGK